MSHQPLTSTCTYSIIPKADIEERGFIDSGGFGNVYEGHHKHLGDVAIKRIFAQTRLSESEEKLLNAEAEKMAKAHFKHVVPLYGVIMEPADYSLVLEYMKYRSLEKFQRDFDNPWAMRIEMIYGIILGMNYLHTEAQIVHRDLKIGNVLIGTGFVAKVCDFGLATWKRISKKYSKRPRASGGRPSGTMSHIAPESLRDINAVPTYACDVFSFGITLWEIFTNKIPFEHARDSDHISSCIRNSQRPPESAIPSECPEFLKTMMRKCWEDNPEERPTFGELKSTTEGTRDREHEDALSKATINLIQQERGRSQIETAAGRSVSQPEAETDSSVSDVTAQMARTTLASQSQPVSSVSVALPSETVQDADQSFEHPPITTGAQPRPTRDSETKVKVPYGTSRGPTSQERPENVTESEAKSSAQPFEETHKPGEHPLMVPPQGLAGTAGTASGRGDSGNTSHSTQGITGHIPPVPQYMQQPGYYPPGMMPPFYAPYPGAPQMYPGYGMQPPPHGGTTIIKHGNGGPSIINISGNTKGVQIGDRNVMYVQPSGRSSKSSGTGATATTTTSSRSSEPRRKIKITTSQTQVTTDDIDKISVHIGHQFRPLGRKCGFSDGQLDGFAHDYSILKEQNYQMLRAWKEEASSGATREKLANLLCEVKLYDTAAKLPYD